MKVEGLTLVEQYNGENGDQEFYERMVALLNLGAVNKDGLLLSVMTRSNLDILELKMFKKLIDWAYFTDDMVASLRRLIRELLARRTHSGFLSSYWILDKVVGDDGKSPEEIVNELLRYAFIIDEKEAEHLVVLLLGIGAQPRKKEALYRLLREAKLLPEIATKMMAS
jgi:hypothetical protein